MLTIDDAKRVIAVAEKAPADGAKARSYEVPVRLRINGQETALTVGTRTSLVDALRERLHLTGTKKGRDHGQCGACTVLVNGRRINACLALAVMHDGDDVTIEGLSRGEDLHPMQDAFVEHDGFRCGYCTPGQIVSAIGVIEEVRAGWPSFVTTSVDEAVTLDRLSDDEIRERMSDNICRCGAYAGILAAVREGIGPCGQLPR